MSCGQFVPILTWRMLSCGLVGFVAKGFVLSKADIVDSRDRLL